MCVWLRLRFHDYLGLVLQIYMHSYVARPGGARPAGPRRHQTVPSLLSVVCVGAMALLSLSLLQR
jgi:hypothetical protein